MFKLCAASFVILFVTAARCEEIFDIFQDCDGGLDCAERNFIGKIDDLDEQENVNVLGNYLSLKRSEGMPQQSRGIEDDAVGRVWRFFETRDLNINVPNKLGSLRQFIEDARSSKLKKFVLPFVVLLLLRKSIEVPILLTVVSILAFKSLGIGLVSLVLSGTTALKSFLEHSSSSKVSYEVVPQLTSAHWSRNSLDYPNLDSYHTLP